MSHKYETKKEAILKAKELGCIGTHEMKDGKFMPCKSHEKYLQVTKERESPDGEIVTIQCKKVWDIERLSRTLMNPEMGAYKVNGKPYVSKQRNLDYVGYGTKDGKVIVAKRQNEVIRQGNEYIYTNKKVLPTPPGKSSQFYIDCWCCDDFPQFLCH